MTGLIQFSWDSFLELVKSLFIQFISSILPLNVCFSVAIVSGLLPIGMLCLSFCSQQICHFLTPSKWFSVLLVRWTHLWSICLEWDPGHAQMLSVILMRISAFPGSFKTCGVWYLPSLLKILIKLAGVWFGYPDFVLKLPGKPFAQSGSSGCYCWTWVWEFETKQICSVFPPPLLSISVKWKPGKRAPAALWPQSWHLHPWLGCSLEEVRWRCQWWW